MSMYGVDLRKKMRSLQLVLLPRSDECYAVCQLDLAAGQLNETSSMISKAKLKDSKVQVQNDFRLQVWLRFVHPAHVWRLFLNLHHLHPLQVE